MNRDEAIEKAKSFLNERELFAYESWCSSTQAPLANELNLALFQLFLIGKDCEEIRRLNPTLSLGQIVAARVSGRWDERKQEHLDKLMANASSRLQQTTLEQADFMQDLLALARKEYGDKIKRYLQTGDPKDAPDIRVDDLRSLKTAVEVLQKLTGQDRQIKFSVSGSLSHTVQGTPKRPTSKQATEALKGLLGPSSK